MNWIQNAATLMLQSDITIVSLLQDTSPTARVVLAIILVFSIWSWGVILSKALLLRKVRKESEDFWRIFRKGKTLSEVATACETLQFTPLVPVFNAGVDQLQPSTSRAQGGVLVKTATGAARLQRSIQRASAAELTRLESRLTFLATTASVTPFIGLLGTVLGVLTSFVGISNSNVATLRAVGPGIAEALIATAAGLFAAIPALVAYNQFVYKIRNIGGELDDLQVELLALADGDDE